MSIPQIQIYQQSGSIGINGQRGQQSLQQPRASVNMRQVAPVLQISQPNGNLQIDQDKAWDALGLASNRTVMNRIYTQAENVALKGIARRMQDGERLGNLAKLNGNNPIPGMAKDWRETSIEYNIKAPASCLNVDVNYTQGNLSIDAQAGYVDRDVQVNAPINNYTRGQLDIYMLQRPSIDVIAPHIDSFA